MGFWWVAGPLLVLHQMGVPVDSLGRCGYSDEGEAWHVSLLEMHQMGAPVGRRLGAAWVYWWREDVAFPLSSAVDRRQPATDTWGELLNTP